MDQTETVSSTQINPVAGVAAVALVAAGIYVTTKKIGMRIVNRRALKNLNVDLIHI